MLPILLRPPGVPASSGCTHPSLKAAATHSRFLYHQGRTLPWSQHVPKPLNPAPEPGRLVGNRNDSRVGGISQAQPQPQASLPGRALQVPRSCWVGEPWLRKQRAESIALSGIAQCWEPPHWRQGRGQPPGSLDPEMQGRPQERGPGLPRGRAPETGVEPPVAGSHPSQEGAWAPPPRCPARGCTWCRERPEGSPPHSYLLPLTCAWGAELPGQGILPACVYVLYVRCGCT